MMTVFRREWRSLFHSLNGYLFFGLFCALTGLFVTTFNLAYGYSNFEFVLSYLIICLWAVLPILTVKLFREEQEGGVGEFLRMLPLSVGDIFWGKLLTAVAVLVSVTAIVALCPLVLSLFGEVHYLSAYVGVLGFFAFGLAALFLEIFLSVALKNPILVWAISYAVPVALVLLGYLARILPGTVGEVVRLISLIGAYTPFVFGILDLQSIILYLSVAAFFLILSLWQGRKLLKK